MESDIVRQLREGYAAFNRGDWDAVLANLNADVEVHERREVPDPGHYEGMEGALEAFAHAGEGFDEYEIVPEEVIEGDDGHVLVVARQRGRGRSSGAVVESGIIHVWTVRGGKSSALRAFSTKEDALEHLGWPSS